METDHYDGHGSVHFFDRYLCLWITGTHGCTHVILYYTGRHELSEDVVTVSEDQLTMLHD